MSNATVVGPATGNVGFTPETTDRWLMNRTGATRLAGDLVMLDWDTTQAETTSIEPSGGTASIYGNAVLAATAFLTHGIFAIVLKTTADNQAMPVRFRGRVSAAVTGGNATVTTDALIAADGSDTLTSDDAVLDAAVKVLALPETVTAAGTEEIITVWFDGIHGFGVKENITDTDT
jgi:hypothetical protein